MKTLIAILGLCISVQAQLVAISTSKVAIAAPAVPNFVSGRSSQQTSNSAGTPIALGTQANSGTGFCPTLTYCAYFPQATLANNLTTVFIIYSSSPSTTLTVTNDQSDTYTAGPVTAARSSMIGAAFYKCGTTTGAREIKIASTGAINVQHVFLGQYNNVPTSSCLDTSNKNDGASGTTLTAGSVTPASSGELIVNDGCAAGTPARTSFTVGSQSNITWAKRGSDLKDGCMEQWGVYNSTSAINPTFTTAPASTFLATSMVFKAASAGTAPSGIYVAYEATYDQIAASTTFAVEFPSTGNLLFMDFTGDSTTNNIPLVCITGQANCSATGLTDSTNTWTNTGPDYWNTTNGGSFQPFNQNGSWSAVNTSANLTGALTINEPSSGGSPTAQFVFYDIAGAATSQPFLTRTVFAGDQANGTAINVIPNFYPGSDNSLVLVSMGEFQNTSVSLSAPACGLFGSSTFGGQPLDGPSQPDENNLLAVCQNSSASSQTWTDVLIKSSSNVGGWSAEANSFLASGASRVGPSYTSLAQNQGTSSSTIAVTIPSTVTGDSLVAVIGSFNSTGRTVSKVCLDDATCAAGNSFTKATAGSGAACTNGGGRGDIWYLLSPNTGKTTVTVTYSGSASNVEAGVYTVRNITAIDTSNHTNSGTGSGNVLTGASVTSTGAPGFLVSIMTTSSGTGTNPNQGNEFGYGGHIFSTTTDAFQSLIAAAGSHHYDTYDTTATPSYCNSIAAFK